MKDKVKAGVWGLFLGGLGVHKFYLGKPYQGILYVLFCWTTIPIFIGFVESIGYFSMSDEEFNQKFNKPHSSHSKVRHSMP